MAGQTLHMPEWQLPNSSHGLHGKHTTQDVATIRSDTDNTAHAHDQEHNTTGAPALTCGC
jgi:hypothetical protein